MATSDNDDTSFVITCTTWFEVEAAIHKVAIQNPNIEQNTLENALQFAKFASERYQVPNEICLGYWPTIRIIWLYSIPSIEIEVFDIRYEYYAFEDKWTDIQEFEIMPDSFPEALKLLLDTTVSHSNEVK